MDEYTSAYWEKKTASFSHTVTIEDVDRFALISGDSNPLHTDDTYASTTVFSKRVAHGMFLGALCSRLVGVYLPGVQALYLKQTLAFKKPVFIGDTVVVTGTVTTYSESTGIMKIEVTFQREGDILADGEAVVKHRKHGE